MSQRRVWTASGWVIDLGTGRLAGKGLFKWPPEDEPWNRGNTTAIFPTRREARDQLRKMKSGHYVAWPKARIHIEFSV